MEQHGIRVFVYGTLKGMARGKFIGKARTIPKFMLFDGAFPVLKLGDITTISDARKGYVLGEVYDVDPSELRELDAYEGYPDLYDRKQFPVSVSTHHQGCELNTHTKAWIYFGVGVELAHRRVIIPDVNQNLYWDIHRRT